ncbi:MAG: hypothetical protein R3B82_22945 [Sandaracinaceae bacterium]
MAARLGVLVCLLGPLAGCGARTGVLDPSPRERPDASLPPDAALPDATVPIDAAPDATVPPPPAEYEPAIMVVAGLFHTCAATHAGRVQCWGFNNQGQLGDGSSETRVDPVPSVGITTAVAVSAGRSHTCALLADATLRCWGSNLAGQVGDGSFEIRQLEPVAVTGVAGVVQVAAGGTHTCARTRDGRLFCWGDNDQGQVGPDARGSYREPVLVPLDERITEVTAGFQHTCVVTTSSRVLCWGEAAITTRRPPDEIAPPFRPAEVRGLPGAIDRLTSGDYETCGIDERGEAWCWHFKRETGGDFDAVVPELAEHLDGFGAIVQISAGHEFLCAVDAAGEATCTGNNERGQLGDAGANTLPGAFVTPIGLPPSQLVTAGWRHACALARDGVVRCWGRNWEGQLGNPSGGEDRPPVVAGVFRD